MHDSDLEVNPAIGVPPYDIVHGDVIGAPCHGDFQLDDAVDQKSSLIRRWDPSLHGYRLNNEVNLFNR